MNVDEKWKYETYFSIYRLPINFVIIEIFKFIFLCSFGYVHVPTYVHQDKTH